jgi:glycosyltransferase involved in cell wall biosynthesis
LSGILVFFHCESNTRYAIGRLEVTFAQMAKRLVGSYDRVHFAYPSLDGGISPALPRELVNFVQFDPATRCEAELNSIKEYIRTREIKVAFGFDQPASRLSLGYIRRGGARRIFSYWGASMSGIFEGPRLLTRRLQYLMRRHCPDHYIFESEGMRKSATHGLGVPARRTSVVRLGVDADMFRPQPENAHYAHDILNIGTDKKVIYYSGHMEERKGVHVIVKAAVHACTYLGRDDLHFVFLGNKNGEEKRFDPIYRGTKAEGHIHFCGYRDDIPKFQASAYLAVIATTGWDSHTLTAVEVAASGVPLLVSDLPGIREAVAPETGIRFSAGDHVDLASRIATLADDPERRQRMGDAARQRVLTGFTRDHQVAGMEAVVRRVAPEISFS